MDVMVLMRTAEGTLTAVGPVSTTEAQEQIREQAKERGWTYVETAPVVAAAEFRQQSQEAEA
jgi:hypothetical protein